MNAFVLPRPKRVRTPIGFIVVALLFYLVDGAIAHSSAFAEQPDVISVAIAIDLTLGVTVAYWAFVVRTGHAALRTVLPVFLVSVAAMMLTLPAGHRDFTVYFRYLAIPLELAVVGVVVAGVRRSQQRLAAAGIELDVPERIRAALGGSSMQSRAADMVAMEMAVFYYAFASWRRKAFVPSNAFGFSYHKKNSYALVLYTIFRMTLVELIVIDFLIRVKSPHAANVILAFDLFAGVWILGLVRSVQQRPIILTRNELQVRNGLHWRLDIPRALIQRIDFGRVKVPSKGTRGYLRAVPGRPNVMIELREPLRARGPYGIERQVQKVGLALDDLAAFEKAYALDATAL